MNYGAIQTLFIDQAATEARRYPKSMLGIHDRNRTGSGTRT